MSRSRRDHLGDELVALLPALRAFTRRFEPDPVDAEDLVQDTLTKALSNLDKFQDGTRLKSWVFTIARNAFCTRYAARKRMVVGLDACVSELPAVAPPQEWAVSMSEFNRAYGALPPINRIAIDHVLFQGSSYEDAALACGCATGTIKSRVNRGRQMLVVAMDPDPRLSRVSGR